MKIVDRGRRINRRHRRGAPQTTFAVFAADHRTAESRPQRRQESGHPSGGNWLLFLDDDIICGPGLLNTCWGTRSSWNPRWCTGPSLAPETPPSILKYAIGAWYRKYYGHLDAESGCDRLAVHTSYEEPDRGRGRGAGHLCQCIPADRIIPRRSKVFNVALCHSPRTYAGTNSDRSGRDCSSNR